MKNIIAFIGGLAAVTFPILFVAYIFKAVVLGLLALFVSGLWLASAMFLRVVNLGNKKQNDNIKNIGR